MIDRIVPGQFAVSCSAASQVQEDCALRLERERTYTYAMLLRVGSPAKTAAVLLLRNTVWQWGSEREVRPELEQKNDASVRRVRSCRKLSTQSPYYAFDIANTRSGHKPCNTITGMAKGIGHIAS